MRKFNILLLASFMVLFFVSCSDDGTSPDINNPETIPDPTEYYVFDIKTKFIEKSTIKGAKAGLIGFIKECSWASEKETGEDYSVWIGDINRTNNGGEKYSISFTLYLCPPTLFGQKESIEERMMQTSYDLADIKYEANGNLIVETLLEATKAAAKVYANAKVPVAGGKAVDEAYKHIGNSEPTLTNRLQQAEGVIIGSMCFGQLKLWINEIEAEN